MKRFKISVKLLILLPVFSIFACSYVTRPTVEARETTWEEVEAKYSQLEASNDLKGSETLSRDLLTKTWAQWQIEFIKFKLAKSLFTQGEYEKSLNVFEHLKEATTNRNEIHITAGKAALNLKRYDDSLRWVLTVYLGLGKEEKIEASKIVFLSYLYSDRTEKAAMWYSKLDDTKKANVKTELDEWFKKNSENQNEFDKYLFQSPENPPDPEIPEQSTESEVSMPASYDGNNAPDWNQLCVMLFSDEKWGRYNEVITSFMNWYFADYRKSGITLNFFQYSDNAELTTAFDKAKELKCFAVAGPFFAPEFNEEFVEKSIEKSIPVFSYTPYYSENKGLFFNIHSTKDIEAENLIKYAVSTKEKKKFALAYLDNDEGKELRDIYWRTIEENGGQVTELIDLSPADNAYFDDIEKVVHKPGNYYEAINTFKGINKSKYSNETLMKRAVDKFTKGVPGRCDFDTLVVLTPVTQMPLFIPSFPYKNIEFEYNSNFLNRNVRLREQNLMDEGFEWNVQQILVLAPAELVNSDKVIEQLGTLVDGTTVYAPVNNFTETNKYYSEMAKIFNEKNSRSMYFVENVVAELADIIFQALEKSGKNNISGLVTVLTETPFISTATGKEAKFDSKKRLIGKNEIKIGRNKDSFIPAPKPEEKKSTKE